MFSCVNGAARGPQGQLAMLWLFFFPRGFSHRQDMEKQLWQVIFFNIFIWISCDKLIVAWKKTPQVDYGRVAMRVWTFECSQRKLGLTNRSTACEDWWKDHRLPELSYPYAGNKWKFLNRGNSLTGKVMLKIICRTSPILIPETARILLKSEDFTFLIGFAVITGRDREEIGRTMDSQFVQMRR